MKNLDFMHFVLLILIFFGIGFYFFYKIKQRIELETFIEVYPGLKTEVYLPPKILIWCRYFLYLTITILIGIAVLNPSFGEEAGLDEKTMSGVDVVFLVDVSLSMNAVDSSPNRLSRFKEVVLHLLPALNGNRMGIIAFAGVPFLYCPMTNDIAAFSDYVRGLDVDIIPNTGTNLKKAFEKTKEVFSSKKIFRNRILVLVTDGEDIKGSAPSKLNDTEIIIWGVGTEEGGNIFYKEERTGVAGLVTKTGNLTNNNSDPDLIRTKLDEAFLLDLASIQSAEYANISANPQGASNLINKIEAMNKNTSSKLSNIFKKDGYQYFLYPAILLILIDLSLIEYLLRKKLR